MSQHDMVIDNGPKGDVVRADFNGALQALASKNSGPGEPSTKYDYMDWPDTNTGYLKQWNPGEGAFDSVRVLDPRILTSAASGGSAYAVTFAPAITGLVAGLSYLFRADVANTGACTFQGNGLTAVPVKKLLNGSYVDLAAGDIPENHLCFMIYSATLAAMVLINPNQAAASSAAIRGAHSNLVITVASDTTYTLTADEVILKNASGQAETLGPLNLTSLDLSQAGSIGVINGIKSAVLGASGWYYPYVIYNGTTTALWLDTSPTAPTLPEGYTYWARFDAAAFKTDASSHLKRTIHENGKTQCVGTGAGLPVMTHGVSGNVSTPTYVAISVSDFVPPIAKEIIIIVGLIEGGTMMIAPNNSYGAFNNISNQPPITITTNGSRTKPCSLLLEGSNIYWASNSDNYIFLFGWK